MVSLKPGDLAPDFGRPPMPGRRCACHRCAAARSPCTSIPRDDTPGCTREACGQRDSFGAFARAGVTILGVSPDGTHSHARFSQKYALPFPLLADLGHRVAECYGVWGQKTFMGKKHMGVLHTTFVVGAGGRIARVFENVKPDGHADEILAGPGIAQ